MGLLWELPCVIGTAFICQTPPDFVEDDLRGNFLCLLVKFGDWPCLSRWESYTGCHSLLLWIARVSRAWLGYFFCALAVVKRMLFLDCCFGNGPVKAFLIRAKGEQQRMVKETRNESEVSLWLTNRIENYSRKTLEWVSISSVFGWMRSQDFHVRWNIRMFL